MSKLEITQMSNFLKCYSHKRKTYFENLKKPVLQNLLKSSVLFQPMLFTIIAKHIRETSEIDKTDL